MDQHVSRRKTQTPFQPCHTLRLLLPLMLFISQVVMCTPTNHGESDGSVVVPEVKVSRFTSVYDLEVDTVSPTQAIAGDARSKTGGSKVNYFLAVSNRIQRQQLHPLGRGRAIEPRVL